MSEKEKKPKSSGTKAVSEKSSKVLQNGSKPKPISRPPQITPVKRKAEEKAPAKKSSEASSGESSDTGAKKKKLEEKSIAGSVDLLEAVKSSRVKAAASVMEFKFNKKRVRLISSDSDLKEDASGIVYWMSRDQRVQDNWAFLYAQRLALKEKLPLHVCFCLVPKFLEATIRHFAFMLKGLEEVSQVTLDTP